MANTIKLGTDGNWAVKENNLLAYNDENNIFKPIDFDFTRDSGATRVNEQGLIENVPIGVPRIDFSDGKGSLLLEPQSMNLITYSEDFSDASWSNLRVTIQVGQNDVFGTNNAYLISNTTDNDTHTLIHNTISGLTASTNYTISCFFKKGTANKIMIRDASVGGYLAYDLENNVVLDTSSLNGQSIVNYGNGYYRISITSLSSSGGQLRPSIYILQDSYISGSPTSYIGNTNENVIITGFQLEEQSYPTSYIPTSGATATRNAETSSKANISNLIGQTEGVAYVEIDWKGNNEESIFSVLHDGTVNNRMDFGYSAVFNSFYFNVRTGGNGQGLMQYASPTIGKYKIAISYKNNDFSLWVNGVKEAVDSSGSVPLTTQYNVGNYIGGGREHSIINSKLYNTVLTDQELQALTS